jgi:ribosomal-protein-alanine N-acetyltransferase
MIWDIYQDCAVFSKNLITLRQIIPEDAEELLKCYSDEKSVPLFNSNNCNGDDFHYTTLERMRQAIDFWQHCYEARNFVRWTVIFIGTGEKIGTIEMLGRTINGESRQTGLLRIDLRSDYETQPVIKEILEIADEYFYEAFDVKSILTKAVPVAWERVCEFTRRMRKVRKGEKNRDIRDKYEKSLKYQ